MRGCLQANGSDVTIENIRYIGGVLAATAQDLGAYLYAQSAAR